MRKDYLSSQLIATQALLPRDESSSQSLSRPITSTDLIIYARHVKSVTLKTHWYYLDGDTYQHEHAWPSVLACAAANVLFPNLTKLHIEILYKSTSAHWDWAALFTVPTLTEIHYFLPVRSGRESTLKFESILSKCLDLEQIELSIDGYAWSWDCIATSPVPQFLRSVKVEYGALGSSFLNWAGQIPRLEVLDLQPWEWGNPLGSRFNRQVASLPNLDLPPESFPSLLSLKLTHINMNLLAQLCCTPIVTHLVKLVIEIRPSELADLTTGGLFALLAERIPRLQEFECSGDYKLENSTIAKLCPLSLRNLKLSGSDEIGPELHMPTLSSFSQTLEVLELNYYIALGTVMLLPLHLPRLEVLSVYLDSQAIPGSIDTSHLAGASLERMRVIWLSRPFNLTIKLDRREELESAKLELWAK